MRIPRIIAVLIIGLLFWAFTSMSAYALPYMVATTPQVSMAGPGVLPDGRRFKYGAWHKVALEAKTMGGIDVPYVEFNTRCTAQVRWYVEETVKDAGTDSHSPVSTLSGTWELEYGAGVCQSGLGGKTWGDGDPTYSGVVAFEGKLVSPGAVPCLMADIDGFVENTSGMLSTAWKFRGKAAGPACHPTKMSMTPQIKRDGEPQHNWKGTSSGTITIPAPPDIPEKVETPPPPPSNLCTKGQPQTAKTTSTTHPLGGAYTTIYYTIASNPGLTGTWAADVFIKRTGGAAPSLGHTGKMFTPNPQSGQTSFSSNAPLSDNDNAIKGVQVYSTNSTYSYNGDKPYGARSGTGVKEYGPGITRPADCLFWLGPKMWDDGVAGSGEDEPYGDVEADPVPPVDPEEPWTDEDTPLPEEELIEEPPCTFDWDDPGTWLEGGMCALVSIFMEVLNFIKQMVSLLANLPNALWLALAGLVVGWFTIDQVFLDGKRGEVDQAWTESSPGQYVDSFGNMVDQATVSASGCAGPSISISTRIYTGDFKPLDACSGQAATAAAISRAALTAGAYFGAFFLVLKMIGASLGLNLNAMGGGKGD